MYTFTGLVNKIIRGRIVINKIEVTQQLFLDEFHIKLIY